MPPDIESNFWLVPLLESGCVFRFWLVIGLIVSLLNFWRIYKWRYYDQEELKYKQIELEYRKENGIAEGVPIKPEELPIKPEDLPIPWQEKLWEASTNFIFQFLGFPLLYISLDILLRLENKETKNVIALSVLFLVLLLYSTFCISGRGIQILDSIRKRITEFGLLWGALKIKLREKESNDK
ncbi:MAG TPA: hypothetical protein ACFYD3_04605 [Candidatus Hypogeohydataceae bacterium YC41]